MDPSYQTAVVLSSRELSEPIDCFCQSTETYDANWNELEEYWGAEKYRLQLEVQLQTFSSSLERQFLFEDSLEKPSELLESETKSKEPNYLHLSDSSYVVRGEDINDIPSSYIIRGLEEHEFPVIGTYVDKRVVPGFPYRVRLNHTRKHLFDGESLVLKSVGMGYGKRLIFENKANLTDNYFWSDTYSEGYGFSLEAIKEGDKFEIKQTDNGPSLGTVEITECQEGQQELSMDFDEDGTVNKRVRVQFWCDVNSSLCNKTGYRASGEVLLSKTKKSTTATVVRIVLKDFVLKNCCLYPLSGDKYIL